MKLLIATPCLTGFTHTYVSSLVGMVQGLEIYKIPFQTLFLANESNIQRVRNDYVNYFLSSPENFTHLMFIDSDMGWEWNDFAHLANAKKRIIAGVCVKKKYPIEEVIRPLEGETPDEAGLLKVKHAPTAFMLIAKEALKDHEKKIDCYGGTSSITGKTGLIVNFFPSGPDKAGFFQSEDFGFTSLMREHGEEIFLHTKAKTTHTGLHTFRSEK